MSEQTRLEWLAAAWRSGNPDDITVAAFVLGDVQRDITSACGRLRHLHTEVNHPTLRVKSQRERRLHSALCSLARTVAFLQGSTDRDARDEQRELLNHLRLASWERGGEGLW